MATIDSLALPFSRWQEGLLALAAALSDPEREAIMIARLEATAAEHGISSKEICALALLVPSNAQFDDETLPKRVSDPTVVAPVEKDGGLGKVLMEIADAHVTSDRQTADKFVAVFDETDPRRILKDTICAFATLQLADVSRRLGVNDPFGRLARRLSLWFKPDFDFSRYGLPYPKNGSGAVAAAVCRALKSITSNDKKRISRLISIWAGDVTVEASKEGVRGILSLSLPKTPSGRVAAVDESQHNCG